MKKQNHNGSVLVVVTIVVVITLLGILGYVAWKNVFQESRDKLADQNTEKQRVLTPPVTENKFTLDDIIFTTPKSWTEAGMVGPNQRLSLIAAMKLLPGEKLRTIYGDGTEYFHVNIAVYANTKNLSPQEWLTNDAGTGIGGQGFLANEDTESNSDINGYKAYHRHVANSSYQEQHYVLSSGDKLVYIYARTYDTATDLPGVGDFRKFESTITSLVQSVIFQ